MTEGQRFAAAELCKACDHLHVSQFKTCLCSTLNGCLSVRVMLQSSSCSQTSVSPGGSSCYAHCCICTRLPKHNELPGVCLQHMYSAAHAPACTHVCCKQTHHSSCRIVFHVSYVQWRSKKMGTALLCIDLTISCCTVNLCYLFSCISILLTIYYQTVCRLSR